MSRAIVFDLDGTLIDSAPDIHWAANAVLAEMNLPQIDLQTLKTFIGNGTRVLMERCLDHAKVDAGAAEVDAAVARFLDFYSREPAARTVVYSGVRDLLASLAKRGDRLGICTNKPEGVTRAILSDLELGPFAVVVGGDTLPTRKPDPAGLLAAIDALGATPADTIFVGDSEVDAETAKAAGVRFALFTSGYRKSPVGAIPHWVAHATFEEIEQALTAPEIGARA